MLFKIIKFITNILTTHIFSSTYMYWVALGITWLEEIQIGLLRKVFLCIDKNNLYLLLIFVDNVRISTTNAVEIFEQKWKTICGFTNWNVNNSLVVCRQLNLSTCVYESIYSYVISYLFGTCNRNEGWQRWLLWYGFVIKMYAVSS